MLRTQNSGLVNFVLESRLLFEQISPIKWEIKWPARSETGIKGCFEEIQEFPFRTLIFVMKNSTHPLLPEISARTTKTVQGLKLTFPLGASWQLDENFWSPS